MKKIYLVRHAQSVGNLSNTYNPAGHVLTENGIKQAQTVARRLKELPIDLIVCSKLIRAVQTARIINKGIKKKIVPTALLNEVEIPSDLYGLKHESKEAIRIWNRIREHGLDPEWHYQDEENFFDFASRGLKCLNYLARLKKENVVVVTHGIMLKMLITLAMLHSRKESQYSKKGSRIRDEPELFYELYHDVGHLLKTVNTGISVLEYGNGCWELLTWNDHAHLG